MRYLDGDRPARKSKRIFDVNPGALESAEAGKELPYGTVLIMEDHPVELESGETPRRDAEGRFIATEEITNVFVMEKQPGWGEAHRSEEHTSELQSLMRLSYAVFCLKQKNIN